MSLYAIHDDRQRILHWDETTFFLVWAWGSDEALQIAWVAYEFTHETGLGIFPEFSEIQTVMESRIEHDHLSRPSVEYPHRERRMSVERLCGWRTECDRQCVHCELYGYDLVSVCDECEHCDECGCHEECSNKTAQ